MRHTVIHKRDRNTHTALPLITHGPDVAPPPVRRGHLPAQELGAARKTRALVIATTHHCVKRQFLLAHNDQTRNFGANRRGSLILQPRRDAASSQP